jgi:hypothetical protein
LKSDKPDDNIKARYDIKDPGFIELVRAVVLGTYTIFSYDPSDDDCKALYAKIHKISSTDIKKDLDPKIM